MNYATTEEAAQTKLTGEITYQPNSDNSYMLCSTKTTKNLIKLTQFVVVEQLTNKIIYTPIEQIKSVKWLSNHELKIEYIPGVAESNKTDYSYTYDVVKQKKVTPNNKP